MDRLFSQLFSITSSTISHQTATHSACVVGIFAVFGLQLVAKSAILFACYCGDFGRGEHYADVADYRVVPWPFKAAFIAVYIGWWCYLYGDYYDNP